MNTIVEKLLTSEEPAIDALYVLKQASSKHEEENDQ